MSVMMRKFLFLAPLLFSIPPESAFADPADNVMIIYGNDRCPTNSKGEEIVVCARRPETERFRIPKEFRKGGKFADTTSWGRKSESVMSVGATGAGSCSASGPAGFTGCAAQDYAAWRAEKNAQKAEQKSVP